MSAAFSRGSPVFRISLPWFLNVVSAIEGLDVIKGAETPNWLALFTATYQLELLFNDSIYAPYLKVSKEKAITLHATISSYMNEDKFFEKQFSENDIWLIISQRDNFRLVFLSEISTLPAFLVGRKESYETNSLIDNGVQLFPSSLPQKVPDAIADAKEVGKALAFELATACGFHIFRVVESVLRRYWDVVSKNADRPRLETIGNYAAEMEKKSFGDSKIIESLRQMAKLHRNPLIHPEVILSVEEAIETLGIARSIIGAMLRTLPDISPTTNLVVPAVSS
jgi:hypothetical protein